MTNRRWIAIALLLASLPLTALAADHMDSPSVLADPLSDITDLYAWVGADSRVRLVLDVAPASTSGANFSTTSQYVFHVDSGASFAGGTTSSRTIVCQAYGPSTTATGMECWVRASDGTVLDYVGGDASATAGITSTSGSVRLFAGLRGDPAFFNLTGFRNMVAAYQSGSFTPDASGCVALSPSVSAALVTQLTTGSDFFAGQNVLAIVLEVDGSLLHPASGSNIVSVWASSHHAP